MAFTFTLTSSTLHWRLSSVHRPVLTDAKWAEAHSLIIDSRVLLPRSLRHARLLTVEHATIDDINSNTTRATSLCWSHVRDTGVYV